MRAKVRAGVAAAAALMLGVGPLATVAGASAPPVDGCVASVNLGSVLVLSQPDKLVRPRLSTNCALSSPSVTIYGPTNQEADFFTWPQSTVGNGAPADWTIYDFNYTAGVTYHVADSYGLDYNFNEVPITAPAFVAKDASEVRLTAARRSGATVTLSGVTAQFLESANFGEGAVAAHAERVVIQRQAGNRWLTVRIVGSNTRGQFSARFLDRAAAVYRAAIPGTATMVTSFSSGRRV